MNKKIIILLLVVLNIFCVPLVAHAEEFEVPDINEEIGKTADDVVVLTTSAETYQNHGLSQITEPRDLIMHAIIIVLEIVALFAIIFIIVGGFFYITSRGEEAQMEKGKKMILSALLGLIVVVSAYTIVATIMNFSDETSGEMTGTDPFQNLGEE